MNKSFLFSNPQSIEERCYNNGLSHARSDRTTGLLKEQWCGLDMEGGTSARRLFQVEDCYTNQKRSAGL